MNILICLLTGRYTRFTRNSIRYLLNLTTLYANFRVAILLQCQTLLWRNATFQARQNSVKRSITDVTMYFRHN